MVTYLTWGDGRQYKIKAYSLTTLGQIIMCDSTTSDDQMTFHQHGFSVMVG